MCLFCDVFIYFFHVSRRVEEVAWFPGLPPRRQLTYQAKQTISREMEREKMRRAEQIMLQRNPATVRPQTGRGLTEHDAVFQACWCYDLRCDLSCRKRKERRALVQSRTETISRGWRTLSNKPQWRSG